MTFPHTPSSLVFLAGFFVIDLRVACCVWLFCSVAAARALRALLWFLRVPAAFPRSIFIRASARAAARCHHHLHTHFACSSSAVFTGFVWRDVRSCCAFLGVGQHTHITAAFILRCGMVRPLVPHPHPHHTFPHHSTNRQRGGLRTRIFALQPLLPCRARRIYAHGSMRRCARRAAFCWWLLHMAGLVRSLAFAFWCGSFLFVRLRWFLVLPVSAVILFCRHVDALLRTYAVFKFVAFLHCLRFAFDRLLHWRSSLLYAFG